MASSPHPAAVTLLLVTVLLVGSARVAAGAPAGPAGAAPIAPVVVAAAPMPVDPAPPVSAPTASLVEPEPVGQPVPPAPIEPGPAAPPVTAPVLSADQLVAAAFEEAVPPRWREILPVQVRVIGGATSYAQYPDLIEIAQRHAEGPWAHLVSVISHEFGHLIAFTHGSRAFDGAAPDGWPDPGHPYPAEAWADCVAQAFTGIVDPSYGMPPCPEESLAWTVAWLDGFAAG